MSLSFLAGWLAVEALHTIRVLLFFIEIPLLFNFGLFWLVWCFCLGSGLVWFFGWLVGRGLYVRGCTEWQVHSTDVFIVFVLLYVRDRGLVLITTYLRAIVLPRPPGATTIDFTTLGKPFAHGELAYTHAENPIGCAWKHGGTSPRWREQDGHATSPSF